MMVDQKIQLVVKEYGNPEVNKSLIDKFVRKLTKFRNHSTKIR